MTSTQTTSEIDIEFLTFIDKLTIAILGYGIEDIPEDLRGETVKNCVKIYTDFIISYIEAKFDKKDAIRLKSSMQFGDTSVFSKFQGLGEHFDAAFEAFKETIRKSWDITNKVLEA